MSGSTHPCLTKEATANPGLYTKKNMHPQIHLDVGYTTVGEKYIDPHKMFGVNPRYQGKQFVTRPLLDKSGGVGYFTKDSYQGTMYVDKSGYLKTQPLDKRKNGFGSKDASKRDEFMSFIRTEQYRSTIKTEKQIMDEQTEKSDPGGQGRQLLLKTFAATDQGFPAGRTEVKHLYDVGRSLETEFDPRASRDCFYNNLMCPSRAGAATSCARRNGGMWTSSGEVGHGVNDMEMEHPHHGHVRATKTFYDKSHLGSPVRR